MPYVWLETAFKILLFMWHFGCFVFLEFPVMGLLYWTTYNVLTFCIVSGYHTQSMQV